MKLILIAGRDISVQVEVDPSQVDFNDAEQINRLVGSISNAVTDAIEQEDEAIQWEKNHDTKSHRG